MTFIVAIVVKVETDASLESAVLNHVSGRLGPLFGSLTTFGRSLLDSPLPLGAAPFQNGVVGIPLAPL